MSRHVPVASDSAASDAGSSGSRVRRNQIHFFTISEVAEMLCVSTRTVRRWIENGQLVAYVVGGVVRIAEADLRAFLALHRRC